MNPEKRKRKNLKRKIARRLCAAGRQLPAVVGLSRRQFAAVVGGTADEYEAYADRFIAAARAARRRWEFPLDPVFDGSAKKKCRKIAIV